MPNAILDPTGTVTSAAKPAAPRAPRLASLDGKRVALLINTKQNARPFLDEVGRLLEDRYGVTVTKRTKVNFAVPEPEDVIKELVAENDVVITGVGDCGSCSGAAAAPGRRDHHRLVRPHRRRDGRAARRARLQVRHHGAPGGRAHRGQGQGAGGAGARRRGRAARGAGASRGMTAANTDRAAADDVVAAAPDPDEARRAIEYCYSRGWS